MHLRKCYTDGKPCFAGDKNLGNAGAKCSDSLPGAVGHKHGGLFSQAGDTMLKIARSYGVLPEVIAEANGLGEDTVLEKGQKLLIPLFFSVLVRVLFRRALKVE